MANDNYNYSLFIFHLILTPSGFLNLIENQEPHQEPHWKLRTSSRTSSKTRSWVRPHWDSHWDSQLGFFFSLRISWESQCGLAQDLDFWWGSWWGSWLLIRFLMRFLILNEVLAQDLIEINFGTISLRFSMRKTIFSRKRPHPYLFLVGNDVPKCMFRFQLILSLVWVLQNVSRLTSMYMMWRSWEMNHYENMFEIKPLFGIHPLCQDIWLPVAHETMWHGLGSCATFI